MSEPVTVGMDYDPFSDELLADPYPHFARLRNEAPVYWAAASRMFCVSRYADAVEVLRAPERFSSDATRTLVTGARPAVDLRSKLRFAAQMLPVLVRHPRTALVFAARNAISLDPPAHTEMRNTVNRAFTPRRIAAWEPRIREIVQELAAALRSKTELDFVAEFAVPLPVRVIVELLGVEPECQAEFKHWSDALVAALFGPAHKRGLARSGAVEALGWLADHMRRAIRERIRAPREDLLSTLVRAQAGEGVLTEAEAVFFAVGLLVAGNETTTRLLGSMTLALLDHPEQLEEVRANRALVPGVVEETLRWEGPAMLTLRRARQDEEIAGTRIPRNALLAVLLASGNRDERQWGERARDFDVTRDAKGHLSFSLGPHFCLGAGLARLEARIALEVLLDELPNLHRKGPVDYAPSYVARGPQSLVLTRSAQPRAIASDPQS